MGEPGLVWPEERTLEHVEINICKECTRRCFGDHVTYWVFKEKGSQWNEQGGVIDGERVDGRGLVLQWSNQVTQKRV